MKSSSKRLLVISTVFLSIIPTLALAIPSTFKEVIDSALETIWILVPILFAMAFVVFFWGLSKFILNSGNQADIKKGKDYMLWGILALFILVSIRAIIAFVQINLELEQTSPLLREDVQQTETSVNIVP